MSSRVRPHRSCMPLASTNTLEGPRWTFLPRFLTADAIAAVEWNYTLKLF